MKEYNSSIIYILLCLFAFSSCVITDNYTANKIAKFPAKLSGESYVAYIDSNNIANVKFGYVKPVLSVYDKEKIKSLKSLGLFRLYLSNAVYQQEKFDSTQILINQLARIPFKYISLNDVSRRMSGIGPIVYSKGSFEENMRDSVNRMMIHLDQLIKVNYSRNSYFLYKYIQRRNKIFESRDKDIVDGKTLFHTVPSLRFRVNINPIEFSGGNKEIGFGASIEPSYKWTNNSSFGLKISYAKLIHESKDYSFFDQRNSSVILTYNFTPYRNADLFDGSSNYFSIGAGIIHTQITGVDDWFYFSNMNASSNTIEDKLYQNILPVLMFRNGIQSRYFRFGAEFNLIPSVELFVKNQQSTSFDNMYFAITYGLVIGSRMWK
jgi:hypothetical protein